MRHLYPPPYTPMLRPEDVLTVTEIHHLSMWKWQYRLSADLDISQPQAARLFFLRWLRQHGRLDS